MKIGIFISEEHHIPTPHPHLPASPCLSAPYAFDLASVADPDRFDTDLDPDPAFHFDTNPDPTV